VREGRLFSAPFALCFAANLLQALAFNLFLHFPGFLQQLGADEVQIGFVSALIAVSAIALRPPIGRRMDRRGRRGVILAGGAVNVVAVALYLTVDRIGPWLYLVRVAHGFAEAMLFSALFTYAADHVPSARRTQGIALFGVSGMLPIALGGAIGDWLLRDDDYRKLFLAALALAAASLLLSLPLRDAKRSSAPATGPVGIVAALRQRDLQPIWLLGTVFSLALTAFFVFIKTFVEAHHVGTVGGFFSAYTAAALVLRAFFGWLPDRVGPKRTLAPALAALAVGAALLARAGSAADVAVAGLLCGFGHGYTFPILSGLVVARVHDANRGAALAVFTGLFDLGVLLGGPAFGLVIERAGYPTMFATAGAVVLAGAILFYTLDRPHKGDVPQR